VTDSQWAKSPKNKTVRRGAFFVISALKIECHVVKNTLLQSAFSVIWAEAESSLSVNHYL